MKKSQPMIVLSVLPILVIAICMVASGCGGGANAVTTVKVKPAELASSGESTGGTGETGGGDVKPVATGEPGSLVGRFKFNGTAPNLAPLVDKGAAVKDAQYCAAEAVPNQSLVVGPDGGIANVFIYLDKAPKGYAPEANLPTVELDQKNCTFVPHGFVLQTGQTLLVKNADGAPHNTNVQTVRNTSFNAVVEPNDRQGKSHVFDKTEKTPVLTKCDFHAWMSAYLMILDHPFVACSKADGSFEIKGLPAGKHTFLVWHESAGLLERRLEVTIKPGEPATVDKSYGIDKFPKL